MKKLFLLIFIFSSLLSNAQELRSRKEITMPLHPWTLIGASYYIQYEQYVKPRQSFTLTAGYKGSDFLTFYFNQGSYNGKRLAYGQRYYAQSKDDWFSLFGEGKVMLEHGNLSLPSRFGTVDSLQTSGFTLSPEILGGFKAVAFKRLVISLNVGLRYRINNLNTQKLTYNPKYWEYDDWNNDSRDPALNRSYITNFNKGLRPSINLNVGFLFR